MASKLMILLVATNALNLLVSIGAHGTEHGDRLKGKPLVNKGNNPTEPLDRCEGDCDRNDDCKGHLRCRQRDAGDPIPPGCSGKAHSPTYDYCWDPRSTKKMVNKESTVRAQGSVFKTGTQSASADISVTAVNAPEGAANWEVGTTLDSNFDSGYPSPFTDESVAAFVEAWNTKRSGEPDTYGESKFNAYVLTSNKEMTNALGISATLEVSYMAYSGDAYMSYTNEHVEGETDVSVMLRATSGGRKYQLGIEGYNLLKLKDNSPETLIQFNEMYGDYLIVGWNYGGEIVHESSFSSKSTEDKESLAAGLCASYDSAGFEVEGCASASNKEEIKKNQVHTMETTTIRPNVQSVDVDNLIGALGRLSSGTGTSQDTKSEIYMYAQHILSGDMLDPLQAVVIPLSSVGAVADKYKMDPGHQRFALFMSTLNNMYMKTKSLLKQLDLVLEEWNKYKTPNHPVPTYTIESWRSHLENKILSEMLNLTTTKLIAKKAKEWYAINGAEESSADVLTAKSFIELTKEGMQNQFDSAIMEPYEKMLKFKASVATLTTQCDDHSTTWVSNDGGSSWNSIVTSDTWNAANSYVLHGVSEDTKIHVKCVNEGGWGMFIATVSYGGETYSTTNPLSAGYWSLVSASDGDTSLEYYPRRYEEVSTPNIASNAHWVWKGRDFEGYLIFEFDFAALYCDCTFSGYKDEGFAGGQWTTSSVGSWVDVGGDVGGNEISSLRVDGACFVTVADGLDGDNPMSPVYVSGSHDNPLPTGNDNIESVLLQCGEYIYSHIGCYTDKEDRAIDYYVGGPGEHKITIDDCFAACSKWRYFALQYGQGTNEGECRCGNSKAEATKYGASTACTSGTGGIWANDLYENNRWDDSAAAAAASPGSLTMDESEPDVTCNSHDDCPADYPFCYDGDCAPCSECEYCHDGIDGTCGPCGDGYPTREGGDCTDSAAAAAAYDGYEQYDEGQDGQDYDPYDSDYGSGNDPYAYSGDGMGQYYSAAAAYDQYDEGQGGYDQYEEDQDGYDEYDQDQDGYDQYDDQWSMAMGPFDPNGIRNVEEPMNGNWSYQLHYYDVVICLLAALNVLCAVNLCVTVRQRQQAQYVAVKHFDTESERDVEAMPMIQ